MRAMQRNAWDGILTAPIGGRTAKPRATGITMVIDKGLGLAATGDLLGMAAPYIDLIKFGFGTSLIYPQAWLMEKIERIRRHGVGVYPGGTFLEIAVAERRTEAFMDRALELGFDWLEVSEGTIDLDDEARDSLIAQSRRRGFEVITEIGKKDRRAKLEVDAVPERMRRDLAGGAAFVIVEGRDSGVGVGVYDEHGVADKAMVDAIMQSAPDPSRLVWEAPKVAQQQAFLLALGPNANFGNVQPEDVITLEATRQGLRGDTLRQALLQIAEK